MRRIALAALLALPLIALAATTATVSPGPWDLYQGTSIVYQDAPTLDACVEAAKARAQTRSYTCRTSAAVAVTVTADPPPPPASSLTFTAMPSTLQAGQASTLAWSSSATSCTLASSLGSVVVAGTGSLSTGPVQQTASVSITCGSESKSVTITVGSTEPPPPDPPPPAPGPSPIAGALEATGGGTRYDVCATCQHTELTTVPWTTLTPGSVVNIAYRAEPYRTKFALRSSGTAAAPIIINGVTDARGRRPVISGDGAVTAVANRTSNQFGSGQYSVEGYALILIRRNTQADPYGYKAKFLTIQNLELRSTYGKQYTNSAGALSAWGSSSAGLWADVVEDLTLDNVVVTDNAFGIFVNNRNAENGVDAETSKRITVRRSQVYGNGKVGSYLEHNLYVQGVGCLIEDNVIGGLRSGAQGSSYKDRCSGTIFRRNTVTCHMRCIDLVHDESGSPTRRDSPTSTAPDYDVATVEDNTITSQMATQCVHFGGDNLGDGAGPFPTYRNGPLRFNRNRCTLNLPSAWTVTVIELQHQAATAVAADNVVAITYRAGGSARWQGQYGTVTLGAGNSLTATPR